MLKQRIKYEDFNGTEQEKDFYFNFTEGEILAMEISEKGGLSQRLERIIEADDPKQIVDTMKELILDAYGERSQDGSDFVKSPEIRARFAGSNAFSELFLLLATDEEASSRFASQLAPPEMIKKIAERFKPGSTDAPLEPTDEELLKMKPQDMTQEQLRRAFQLKFSQS